MPQEHVENAVDSYVTERMAAQHVPGLSLAVIHEGRVLRARGYGLADVEQGVPATPDTVYQIGSLTKQFTAVAVMRLVEQNKITLEESISRYLSGLPDAWGGVTVRHLLNHTAGIKSFTGLPDFLTRLAPYPAGRDQILASVAGEPLEFAPGMRYAYSNTGYFLLGYVIEEVSGQPYAAFLHQNLFAPLGMDATRVNDPDDIIPCRASGYVWGEDRLWNARPVSLDWVGSAGALVSTVLDLARWDAALGSAGLLSEAGWEQTWTPATLGDGTRTEYGFGWIVGNRRGCRTLSHGGGIPGFTAFMERLPCDGLTVIVLTNLSPADPAEIARSVVGLYVPGLDAAS